MIYLINLESGGSTPVSGMAANMLSVPAAKPSAPRNLLKNRKSWQTW